MLNDRFVPHKTIDDAAVATLELETELPAGASRWNYHAIVLGQAKVKNRQREL